MIENRLMRRLSLEAPLRGAWRVRNNMQDK